MKILCKVILASSLVSIPTIALLCSFIPEGSGTELGVIDVLSGIAVVVIPCAITAIIGRQYWHKKECKEG